MAKKTVEPKPASGRTTRYASEKLSDLLYRIHIHPGDANMRLASEWFNIRFIRSELLALDLDRATRRQLNALVELIEGDSKWLATVRQPRGLGRIRNVTSARYIAMLMRIHSQL